MMSVGTSALLHWITPAISDEDFERMVVRNPELNFERTAEGDLVVTPPTGSDGGRRNANLIVALGVWNAREGKGIVFDSNAGFRLSDSAIRSPDASWIERSRWDVLTPAQRKTYSPLAPDAVFELLSHSDRKGEVRDRIASFRKNGTAIAVLIDPYERTFEINGERRPWARTEIFFPGCVAPFVFDPADLE